MAMVLSGPSLHPYGGGGVTGLKKEKTLPCHSSSRTSMSHLTARVNDRMEKILIRSSN